MAVMSSPNCTEKTFAWSASCDWHLVTKRPTLGVMVVCPGFFKQSDGEQLATMVHEAIHALVSDPACKQKHRTVNTLHHNQHIV